MTQLGCGTIYRLAKCSLRQIVRNKGGLSNMQRPAGWAILLLGAAVACIGYLGFTLYPASLSAIPYHDEFVPFLMEGWREQRDLYTSIFESKLGVFVRGHPMEMMGGYGLIGLLLLLSRGYRDAGWEHGLLVLWYGLLIPILFFLGLLVVKWGFYLFNFFRGESTSSNIARMRTDPTGWLGNWAGGLFIGVPAMLIGLIIGLVIRVAVYAVPPIYVLFVLFALPSIVYAILRFLVRLPFLAYHFLHYLTVPHPAERIFRKHEKVSIKRGVKVDHVALGEELGGAMYNMEREGFPAWWKSENWKRRLEKLRERLRVERDIVDDATDRARERNRTRR